MKKTIIAAVLALAATAMYVAAGAAAGAGGAAGGQIIVPYLESLEKGTPGKELTAAVSEAIKDLNKTKTPLPPAAVQGRYAIVGRVLNALGLRFGYPSESELRWRLGQWKPASLRKYRPAKAAEQRQGN